MEIHDLPHEGGPSPKIEPDTSKQAEMAIGKDRVATDAKEADALFKKYGKALQKAIVAPQQKQAVEHPIPQNHLLRKGSEETLSAQDFLSPGLYYNFRKIEEEISKLPEGATKQKIIQHVNKLEIQADELIQKKEKLKEALGQLEGFQGGVQELKDLIDQYAMYDPERVKSDLLNMVTMIEGLQIQPHQQALIKGFEDSSKAIQGKLEKACAFLDLDNVKDFKAFQKALKDEIMEEGDLAVLFSRWKSWDQILEIVKKDPNRKNLLSTDGEIPPENYTKITPEQFEKDQKREVFQIEGKSFSPKKTVEEVNDVLNKLIQGMLPKDIPSDEGTVNLIRYEIERCFNQLALADGFNRSGSRYLRLAPQDYLYGLLTISYEKNKPRFEIYREKEWLKLVVTEYQCIKDMNVGTRSTMKTEGYGAIQTEIRIDFSKMKRNNLLLSPGCMTVIERSAGFKEKPEEVQFSKK